MPNLEELKRMAQSAAYAATELAQEAVAAAGEKAGALKEYAGEKASTLKDYAGEKAALLTEKRSDILPTIVSRSVVIRLKPVEAEEEYCADCAARKQLYYRGMAVYRYRSVSGSLYRFKYDGRREYADFYGEGMARAMDRFLRETGPRHAPELLIPVPCSAKRIRKRGYNQAALLARRLSGKTGIPAPEGLLIRSRDTRAMRGMTAAERQINLKRTFHVYGNGVRLKSIMLIDDIYTTGATIDACAGALLEAGAEEVSFLTLAIGENAL